MTRPLSLFLLPLATLAGCAAPPELTGTVVDIWGTPIVQAEVKVEGVSESVMSGPSGGFKVANVPPGTRKVVAMKDGFIKNVIEIDVPEDRGAEMPAPKLELYDKPEKPGFYLVGQTRLPETAYHPMDGVSIESMGTEFSALTGLQQEGQAKAPANTNVRFVFSSTLRASQLSQIDLQLHSMEFVPKREVTGVLGETDVKINLWVADERTEFDIEGLPSESDYLLTSRDKLKPGIYAFHTEGSLTASDKDALDKMPEELKVAYPFEVK